MVTGALVAKYELGQYSPYVAVTLNLVACGWTQSTRNWATQDAWADIVADLGSRLQWSVLLRRQILCSTLVGADGVPHIPYGTTH
jgi:hypothetical protein